jgi:peptidoglycan-associated lipoprotein
MLNKFIGIAALTALLVLQGCSGDGATKPEEDNAALVEQRAQQEAAAAEEAAAAAAAAAAEEAEARAAAEAQAAELDAKSFQGQLISEAMDNPDSNLSKRVFYFGFDLSDVTQEDREILETHAALLAAKPEISVVVEGHADERGSREYNLALGERRAQAVEQLLLIQGASKDQIQLISFGEERPVALGHDEDAWRLNRRVELIYSGY